MQNKGITLRNTNCEYVTSPWSLEGLNVASAIPTSTIHAQDYLKWTDTPFDLNEARPSKVLKLFLKANAAKAFALLR